MAAVNIYDMTDTWNNGATVFSAIKMNVTLTAAAALSSLINLQVDGTTRFRVDSTYGAVVVGVPTTNATVGVLNGKVNILPGATGSSMGAYLDVSINNTNSGQAFAFGNALFAEFTLPSTMTTTWYSATGLTASAFNNSPYNLTGSLTGLTGFGSHAGTGTCASVYGLYYGVQAFNDGFGNPGTVASAIGVGITDYFANSAVITIYSKLRVWSPEIYSGATITDAYGLRISQINVSGVTNGWNISSEGATSRNYFAGFVGIGQAVSSTYRLGVAGQTQLVGGTVTVSTPVLDVSQTWNAGAVTFVGLNVDITNTASAAASSLFNFKVGGTSIFRLEPGGRLVREVTDTNVAGSTTGFYSYSTKTWSTTAVRTHYELSFTSVVTVSGGQPNGFVLGTNSYMRVDGSGTFGSNTALQGGAEFYGSVAASSLVGLSFYISPNNSSTVTTASILDLFLYPYDTSVITTAYGIRLRQPSGNGGTVTTNYGLHIATQSAVSGSGTITNGWNLFSAGATSRNYFEGFVGIHTAVVTTAILALGAGTTAKAQINLASSTAPSSPVDGDIWFDGTDIKMRVAGATKTFTLV